MLSQVEKKNEGKERNLDMILHSLKNIDTFFGNEVSLSL